MFALNVSFSRFTFSILEDLRLKRQVVKNIEQAYLDLLTKYLIFSQIEFSIVSILFSIKSSGPLKLMQVNTM